MKMILPCIAVLLLGLSITDAASSEIEIDLKIGQHYSLKMDENSKTTAWLLTCPENQHVSLFFNEFNFEVGKGDLFVTDGNTNSMAKLSGGPACRTTDSCPTGTAHPLQSLGTHLQSPESEMSLAYVETSAMDFRVFEATVKCKVCSNTPSPHMLKKGQSCYQQMNKLEKRCKLPSWIENRYCAQSCFEQPLGKSGYKGMDCSDTMPRELHQHVTTNLEILSAKLAQINDLIEAPLNLGTCIAGSGTFDCTLNDEGCHPTIPCVDGTVSNGWSNNCICKCDDGYSGTPSSYEGHKAGLQTELCTASACAKPAGLAAGVTTTCSDNGELDLTKCDFGCEDGYALSGTTASTCTADSGESTASFQGQSQVCTAATCAEPSGLATGITTTCTEGGTLALTTCSFGCEDGYALSGTPASTCTADVDKSTASYQGQAIKCAAATCAKPAGLAAGVTTTCTADGALGTTCSFGCGAGYRPSGTTASTCTADYGASTASYKGHSQICTAMLCDADQYVSQNACVACAAGKTNAKDDDASGSATECDATLCTADRYVSTNLCEACAAGKTNAADDNASGDDTTCDATLCAADQYVFTSACKACAAGKTNAADDVASGDDTTCDATLCTADQYVSTNVCKACAAGKTNAADDDASGVSTYCE